MNFPSERLAYWYFRINGFLTTENFIVHPDEGSDQRTDADLLAVRFANRSENLVSPMQDDPKVAHCKQLANIIIAEIKTGNCALNGPWTDTSLMNMERVLQSVGCVDLDKVNDASGCLYKTGLWQSETVSIRLFAVGENRSSLVIPETQQITWSEIIDFLIKRFWEYRQQKSSIGQWTDDGIQLRKFALKTNKRAIRKLFCLQQSEDDT